MSPEEGLIDLFEFEALGGADAGPAQADGVQAADAIVATRDCERGQILADGGASLHEG